MYSSVSSAVGWIRRRAENVVAGLLGIMFVAFVIEIVFRYVLAVVAPWTEELERFACIWSVFLATAVCFDEGTHIRLDLIVTKVSRPATRRIMLIASVLVTGTFVAVVLYGSILLSQVGWVDFATTVPVRMRCLPGPAGVHGGDRAFGALRAIEAGIGRKSRGSRRMPEEASPSSSRWDWRLR